MANYSLNEHQKHAVEALVELKRICDKHGIRFLLLAGSCLGAVRHKGMIPWDDDVDVGLLYDDWLKLRKILPKELAPDYQYADDETENTWPRLFGKILYQRRNCVDIFLIAKWTSNPFSARLHWIICKVAKNLYLASINHTYDSPLTIRPGCSTLRIIWTLIAQPIKKSLRFLPAILKNRSVYIRLSRWNERYFEGKNSCCYINIYSVYSMEKETIRAEWIEKTSFVEYEGEMYETVGNIEAYLTHLYGDYLTLPPEEKRMQLHNQIL